MPYFVVFPDDHVLRYDISTGSIGIATSDRAAFLVRQLAKSEHARLGQTEASALLLSEACRVVFGENGGRLANAWMKENATLFGRRRKPKCHQGRLIWMDPCRNVRKVIRWVFRNRGRTDWAISGLGRGVRRVYPSNGGIHCLSASIIPPRSAFEMIYDPYGDYWERRESGRNELNAMRILLKADLERLSERYTDVKSLGALFVELGHALSAVCFALFSREVAVESVCIMAEPNPDNPLVATLAVLTLGNG